MLAHSWTQIQVQTQTDTDALAHTYTQIQVDTQTDTGTLRETESTEHHSQRTVPSEESLNLWTKSKRRLRSGTLGTWKRNGQKLGTVMLMNSSSEVEKEMNKNSAQLRWWTLTVRLKKQMVKRKLWQHFCFQNKNLPCEKGHLWRHRNINGCWVPIIQASSAIKTSQIIFHAKKTKSGCHDACPTD